MKKAWLVEVHVYENGEKIRSDIVSYEDKEIYFSSFEQAEEYANEQSCDYGLYYPIEIEINLNECISYKVLKERWAKEAEAKKKYLKSCPFCGNKPERNENFAECKTCNIKLKDETWNTRKT